MANNLTHIKFPNRVPNPGSMAGYADPAAGPKYAGPAPTTTSNSGTQFLVFGLFRFGGSRSSSHKVNLTTPSYEIIYNCSTHHGTFTSAWNNLYNVPAGLIKASDFNSVRIALSSLRANWRSGNDRINTPRLRMTASVGRHVKSLDMQNASNLLDAFGVVVDYPTNADKIQLNFINNVISKYRLIIQRCLCNSDCACNSVCSCNLNCGCNYSDRRLKINLEIKDYIKLKGKVVTLYTFDYKQDTSLTLPLGRQTGVMAQDLLELGLDEYVIKDETYYRVNYKDIKWN